MAIQKVVYLLRKCHEMVTLFSEVMKSGCKVLGRLLGCYFMFGLFYMIVTAQYCKVTDNGYKLVGMFV